MEPFEFNRRHVMKSSLGVLAGLAGAMTELDAQASDKVDAVLYEEITAVLDRTAELFNTQQSVVELWDQDDSLPYYIAEEVREPIVGWDALNAYMDPARKRMLDTFRWGYSNLQARYLCPDIALALFDHWFEILIVGDHQVPRAGFDRVLAIYRKRPEGWKQILYAQCPYGPYDYVQALRERAVSPDFEEFRAKTKEAAND
jgi:hypothetical protein